MGKKYWIPQALTVSRMAAALVLGQQIVFAETAAGHLPVILALTGYIFLSDLLDGRLARKWACCSPIGAKLDIAADLLCLGLTPAAVMSRFHVRNESSHSDGQYRKGFVE